MLHFDISCVGKMTKKKKKIHSGLDAWYTDTINPPQKIPILLSAIGVGMLHQLQ